MEEETISISVNHPPSRGALQPVGRSVSLLQEELEDYVEERRPSQAQRRNKLHLYNCVAILLYVFKDENGSCEEK